MLHLWPTTYIFAGNAALSYSIKSINLMICFHPCVYIINSLSFSKVFHPFVFLYKECCLQIVDPGTTEIEKLRLKIAYSQFRNQGIKMD